MYFLLTVWKVPITPRLIMDQKAFDGLRNFRISLAFRQRDELGFARHRRESSGLPVFLGLLDPLLARGHEIPPDIARAFQCRAAEEHQPRGAYRPHTDAVAGTEHQKPRAFERLAGDIDLAFDHIDRAFLVVGIERRARARGERHFG